LTIEEGYAAEIAALKQETTEAYRAYLGPYAAFPSILREAMPRDAVWARDVTLNNSTWGNRIFPLYGPRDSVYPVGAAIGPGLPFGIGAALAATGRKTVCMCGDGGFALSVAELWTARKEQADVVFLVMNDGGYGVIRHIQNRMYGGRNYYDDVLSPELEPLAALAGMPYQRVSAVDELGPAVTAALAIEGPALVEVDMAAIGEFPPYFAPPPYVAEEAE
jgi:acetolactate synthase-1/2/3 large subunit